MAPLTPIRLPESPQTTPNDTINGLDGNDFIKDRGGSDKIDGGPGNDTYMFVGNWGIDRISADSGASTR